MRTFSTEAHEWLVNYHGSIDSMALLLAFDAGRASRDAEVAELERHQEALLEQVARMAHSNARLTRDLATAVARAEAAEAVIAEAVDHLQKSRLDGTGKFDLTWNNALDYALGKLIVAPQTVLAERDRKNRREGWDEGYTAGWNIAWDGRMLYDLRAVDEPPEVSNPYTEKEQGNGNN